MRSRGNHITIAFRPAINAAATPMPIIARAMSSVANPLDAPNNAAPAAATTSPTSSSLKTKLWHIKGIGFRLVTIWRLDPSVLWGDDVRGYCEVAIDLLDVGFWRGGLADAQT